MALIGSENADEKEPVKLVKIIVGHRNHHILGVLRRRFLNNYVNLALEDQL